jgi:isopentenyldiphosphate isomerase
MDGGACGKVSGSHEQAMQVIVGNERSGSQPATAVHPVVLMSFHMPESIEVLSKEGRPTGTTKLKREIHRDGDWHLAAHVWILTPSNLLLLQRRSLAKENFPGKWDVSAAGHVSRGESVEQAAVRETREELGLEIAVGELERISTTREEWTLNDGTYIDREIHEIFLVVRDVRPDALVLQIGEVDEAVLMPVDTFQRHVENRDPSLVPHWAEYDLLLAEIMDR